MIFNFFLSSLSFNICTALFTLFSLLYIFTLIRNHRLINNQNYINRDSTVLITGGSIGIGFELIKLLFSRTKCRIINVDIRDSCFPELENLANLSNTFIECFKCDLSNIDEMNETFHRILSKYKKIDFLINNAGLSFNKEFEELKEEEIIKTVNVNMIAPSLICKKVIPLMINNNFGHVVTVASVLSHLTRMLFPIIFSKYCSRLHYD
jgi:short-subunit dehydrogenase